MDLSPMLSRINPLNWRSESRALSSKAGAVPDPDAQSLEALWLSTILGGSTSAAGVAVNRDVALGVSTVFACVDVKARTIGSLPLMIYRRLPGNDREPAYDHPLYSLLHDAPNDEMTSSDFRRAMQANLELHQSAYALISRNGFREITGLVPVPACDVDLKRQGGQLQYHIGSSVYDPSQVVHLRGTSFNGLLAPELMHTCRDAIGLAVALDRNAGYFFKNGSFPGGFLEHPARLSTEAATRLQDAFQEQTGGANSGKVKVLEEGLKYSAGRAPNTESQFDESRDRQSKEIARIFGVPGHKVGIVGNQPRANVEQENTSFVTDTIRPVAVTWEQALNQKLLSRDERAEYYIEINLDGLLRGDVKTRYETYDIAIRNGILSPNECRKKENLNRRDGGDVFLQPMNMKDSSTPAAPAAVTPADSTDA